MTVSVLISSLMKTSQFLQPLRAKIKGQHRKSLFTPSCEQGIHIIVSYTNIVRAGNSMSLQYIRHANQVTNRMTVNTVTSLQLATGLAENYYRSLAGLYSIHLYSNHLASVLVPAGDNSKDRSLPLTVERLSSIIDWWCPLKKNS